MALTIELTADLEQRLRREVADLDRAAKEALLVQLFRQGKLSHRQLSESFALDRIETDGVLKRHGVMLDLTPHP